MCVCVCLKEIAGDDREGEMVCVRACVWIWKQHCKVERDGVSVGIKRYGDMTGEASQKSIRH